jgi:enoyl-CoA hydratase/carnithine racemase
VAEERTVVAVPARAEVSINIAHDVARDMAAVIADDLGAGEPVVGERVHAADADEDGLVDRVVGDELIRDLLHVEAKINHLGAASCDAVRRAVRGEILVITT